MEENSIGLYLTRDIPKEAREWRNEREVYRWCRQCIEIDEDSHQRWLKRISEDQTIKMFGIWADFDNYDPHLPDFDRVGLGVCGLTSINQLNQSAEFSLYIAPKFQRRGYGKLALKNLLKIGFFDMNLHRIWGETFDGNPAAQMFESLGFVKEGTLKESYFKDGKFIDSHIYAMLRPTSQL